jgi:hypothetical protein
VDKQITCNYLDELSFCIDVLKNDVISGKPMDEMKNKIKGICRDISLKYGIPSQDLILIVVCICNTFYMLKDKKQKELIGELSLD